MKVIKTTGFNQQEMINDILQLYNHSEPIHLDPCYNVGGFIEMEW